MRVGQKYICSKEINLKYASLPLSIGDEVEILQIEENFMTKSQRPDYADWDYMVNLLYLKNNLEFKMNSETFFEHFEINK